MNIFYAFDILKEKHPRIESNTLPTTLLKISNM
jgi:hypothetical protein